MDADALRRGAGLDLVDELVDDLLDVRNICHFQHALGEADLAGNAVGGDHELVQVLRTRIVHRRFGELGAQPLEDAACLQIDIDARVRLRRIAEISAAVVRR